MNLGLGNLTELKTQLLAPGLLASTEYDVKIAAIGKGVTGAFEKYCNRKFERVAGALVIFQADRDHFVLPRYPIETVTKIEQRDSLAEGWVELPITTIENLDEASGQIFFGARLGTYLSMVRVTFTGGYWFDAVGEDDEESEAEEQPEGSSLVPDDLKLAWILMSKAVWESIDKIGDKITEVGSGAQFVTGTLAGLDWPPQVKQIVDGYRRFQLT